MGMNNIQVPPVGMRIPVTPNAKAPSSVPRKNPQGGKTMNVQEEILKIKEEMVAEFNKRVEELVQEEESVMILGEAYYYFNSDGTVYKDEWEDHWVDKGRLKVGNVFLLEEEALAEVEKRKVEKEIKNFRRPFIFGRKNWYLFMDENKQIFPIFDLDEVTYGVVYFESKEKAEEAIETVGIDRIKKYIFGEGE